MSVEIREVLNRRTDLSTFVVHLTRDDTPNDYAPDAFPLPLPDARANLRSIIEGRALSAGRAMGWALGVPGLALNDAERESQRVVCFSETPLEHAYSLFSDIRNRAVKLKPYGVAFTKMVARRMGIQPVWYVDMTPGRAWVVSEALNGLVRAAAGTLNVANIGKMTPFIEGMGTWAGGDPEQREFWWEREWRHHGQIDLAPWWDKAVWLCPEEQSASSAPWWKPWAEFPAPVSTPIGDWSRSSATCRDSPPTT
ncbi:MAG TPA: hypothetical protein VN960_08155 [Gaiellaceae bacterium]|jgi:hypothetical protein|nr:hypothetical protein [Gaiellaceae bacterium]